MPNHTGATAAESRRVIGVTTAAVLVVANMVGTGIFTTTGFLAAQGARGGDILLLWLLGGVLALCGAFCYGELGANMPESGGEYTYLTRILHPGLGFLSGWVSLFVGFSAPIAAAAMAMHLYLARVVPGWPVRVFAVLTILILGLLHAYDLRLGSGVQNVLTGLKVVLILLFIGSVLFLPGLDTARRLVEFRPELWLDARFAVALVFVSFAYSGWNAAAYIGAEIRRPHRNLPLSLFLGTGVVILLYLFLNAAFLLALPVERLAGVPEVAHEVGQVVWGTRAGRWMSVAIAVSLVSTVSAMALVGPRVLEAMARDGLLPASLARLNRRGVPAVAVTVQTLIAALFASTAAFGPLLVYIGYTLNIFTALAAVAVLVARHRGQVQVRTCWGYPVTPLVFLAFALWLTVWSIRAQPISTLAGLATLGLGSLVYVWQNRRRRRNGGTPPVPPDG